MANGMTLEEFMYGGTNKPQPAKIPEGVISGLGIKPPEEFFGIGRDAELTRMLRQRDFRKSVEREIAPQTIQPMNEGTQFPTAPLMPEGLTQPQGLPTTSAPAPQGTLPQAGPRPLTAEEQARQNEILGMIRGGQTTQERTLMERELEQRRKIEEAKVGIGARTIIKSMIDESGQEPKKAIEDIKKQIGFHEGMTRGDVLRSLQRLQTSRAKTRAGMTETTKRTMDRIIEGQERDEEGNAVNAAAKLIDIDDVLNSGGADPGAPDEFTLRDNMTESQKREYRRLVQKVDNGYAKDKDFKLINKFVDDIVEKDQRKFLKKQNDEAKENIRQAERRVDNTEKRTALDGLKASREAIVNRIEDRNKPTRPSKEELNQLYADLKNIDGQIISFGQGGAGGQYKTHKEANDAAKAAGLEEYQFGGINWMVH